MESSSRLILLYFVFGGFKKKKSSTTCASLIVKELYFSDYFKFSCTEYSFDPRQAWQIEYLGFENIMLANLGCFPLCPSIVNLIAQ